MKKVHKTSKHIALVLPAKKPARGPVVEIPEPAAPAPSPAPGPAPAKTVHPAVPEIAAALGETKRWPLKQIRHIVWALGGTQARELVARAQEIHAGEGLLIKNGKRQRTLGGVWFHLAYTEGRPKEGRTLIKPDWRPKKKLNLEAERVGEAVKG